MACIQPVLVLGLLSATVMPEKDDNTKNLKDQLLFKGSVGSKNCSENEYISKGRCCQKCAAGTYVSEVCTTSHGLSSCDPCRDGEDYTEAPHGMDRCLTCNYCRVDDQIQVAPCTRAADAKCQCKEGKYCIPLKSCDLYCTTCNRCTEGQFEKFPCTPTADAVCEDFPVTNSTTRPTYSANGTNQDSLSTTVVVLSVLAGICIVVICILVFFIFRYKRKKDKKKPEDAEIQLLDNIVRSDSAASALRWSNKDANILLQAETDPEIHSEATKCDDQCEEMPAEMDDKGWSHLYICLKETILPSRWKELMRLLGLADVNIETISMDYQNDVSEQNYQMLLAWRKQEGQRATVGAIYDVLKAMKLPECRYRIEEALKDKRIPIA